MTVNAIPGPAWIPVFLETLQQTHKVGAATQAADISPGSIYAQRRRNQLFAAAWNAALGTKDVAHPAGADGVGPAPANEAAQAQAPKLAPTPAPAVNGGWQKPFLEKLAETSNIRASATFANVPLSTVYKLRAQGGEFAGKWDAALYEGYTNLEMEVLGYLRDADPGFKMDVANALRLLAAHKETVAREKARRSRRDKKDVLASLNAKIDKMRERKAAAEKLLAAEGALPLAGHGNAHESD